MNALTLAILVLVLLAGCTPPKQEASDDIIKEYEKAEDEFIEKQKEQARQTLLVCERDIADLADAKRVYIVCINDNKENIQLGACLGSFNPVVYALEEDTNILHHGPSGIMYPWCRNASQVGENKNYLYCYGARDYIKEDKVNDEGTIIEKGWQRSHDLEIVVKPTFKMIDVAPTRRFFPADVVSIRCATDGKNNQPQKIRIT